MGGGFSSFFFLFFVVETADWLVGLTKRLNLTADWLAGLAKRRKLTVDWLVSLSAVACQPAMEEE